VELEPLVVRPAVRLEAGAPRNERKSRTLRRTHPVDQAAASRGALTGCAGSKADLQRDRLVHRPLQQRTPAAGGLGASLSHGEDARTISASWRHDPRRGSMLAPPARAARAPETRPRRTSSGSRCAAGGDGRCTSTAARRSHGPPSPFFRRGRPCSTSPLPPAPPPPRAR
jgi:hypothetical protein